MKNLFDRIEKSTLNTPKPFVVQKESQKPQEAVMEEIRKGSRRSLPSFAARLHCHSKSNTGG